MVQVDVGNGDGDSHTFVVHKEIICHHSPFFKAACTGHFREAEDRVVKLPDDRAELFDIFLQWLYSQNLQQVFAEVTLPAWTTFIELYILADKLQVRTLKSAIMDQMVCRAVAAGGSYQREKFPTNADIRLAYETTPPTSPMRQFLAELFAFLQELPIDKDEVPKDYLYDLAIAQRLGGDWQYPMRSILRTPCRYHERENGGRD